MSGLPKLEDLPEERQQYYKKMLEYNTTHNDLDKMMERRNKLQEKLEQNQTQNQEQTQNTQSIDTLTPEQKQKVMNDLKNITVNNKKVNIDETTGEMTMDISVPNPYRQIFKTYMYVKQGLISGLDPIYLEPHEQVIMKENEGDDWYTKWGRETSDTFPQYT